MKKWISSYDFQIHLIVIHLLTYVNLEDSMLTHIIYSKVKNSLFHMVPHKRVDFPPLNLASIEFFVNITMIMIDLKYIQDRYHFKYTFKSLPKWNLLFSSSPSYPKNKQSTDEMAILVPGLDHQGPKNLLWTETHVGLYIILGQLRPSPINYIFLLQEIEPSRTWVAFYSSLTRKKNSSSNSTR